MIDAALDGETISQPRSTTPWLRSSRGALPEVDAGSAAAATALMDMIRNAKAWLESGPEGTRSVLRLLTIRPLRAYFRYFPVAAGKVALWSGTASHLWWLESSVIARTRFGTKLLVDASDIVGKYIYYFGEWEPNLASLICRRLAPGDVFVDVGANIGYFSTLGARVVGPTGKVVAIEALPETAERLRSNVERNGARNVRIANVAAWHEEDSLPAFTRAAHASGTTTLVKDWAQHWELSRSVQVAAKRLGAILTLDELSRTRLVKIDVEGAEWNVISGMTDMLESCRYDIEIVVELSSAMLATQDRTRQDVLDLFAEHGFHAYHLVNDYTARSYLARTVAPAQRLHRVDDGPGDQMDIVFSRIDAPVL